tara:strand:- start:645 stop:1145 length:501 start_codon:yes stop_codon:yes gene_type:complete
MKSHVQQFLVISLIFLFSAVGFSQATITIKLIVDTANFDPDKLPASCSFEATWSDSGKVVRSGGDIENFTIDVFVDDTILWEGHSSSSDIAIIDIKKIDQGNDSKIFKTKKRYGKKRGNSKKETVEDQVLFTTKGKPDYKYKIFFKINHRGKTHKIDPKIKVGSRS